MTDLEVEKDTRICRFCGEIKTESHHCSGKKAFQFGYNKAIEDYAKGEK